MKRGAYCNTDHHLVCARLKFERNNRRSYANKADQKMRFNVGKLNCSESDTNGCWVADCSVLNRVSASWPEDGIG